MAWTTDSIPSLQGKIFLVTGGNTGIGFATVSCLAVKGATVILACRNTDKGKAALGKIRSVTPGADIVLEQLDLASLASIKAFADRMAAKHPRLDVLINNAGVATPPFGRTDDGFEIQFGTNVLGTFALTGRLLPLLSTTPGSRIVTLSSLAHWFGKIDFDNLNAERGYAASPAYCQSKLGDLVFAYELQRRLARSGAATISIGVHPGITNSDLFRHNSFMAFGVRLVAQSIEQGAWPSLMAATSSEVKGGDYVGPGGFLTMKGLPTIQKSSTRSKDEVLAGRLWDAAQSLTGVRYL